MTATVSQRTGLGDLHCHILPALDDGARDLPDACAMVAQGARDGITAICATPHIRHDHAVHIDALPALRAELNQALQAAGHEVAVLPGGEVAADALADLGDSELAALTLGGGGGWILLEPAPGPIDRRLDRAVARLCARGLNAVVAHPERHWSDDLPARLQRLVRRGCLIQVTAAHVTDPRTRDGVFGLARRGLVHVLGSDAHSASVGRPVALAQAFDVLAEIEPMASHLAWITHTAPRAIVAGGPVTPPY